MNTVGKPDTLGGAIRCVVSVSMLTEGWDARTVTHVLGVRAFGTQLLCEQVIGRALRRQSYDPNDDGLFDVEYADVLGIPFDFTAEPVPVKPQKPRETVLVKAITPERDACEIRFPRVEGYRVELPQERLTAKFGDDATLELTPDLVGPSITRNEGIIGEGVDLNLIHTRDLRKSRRCSSHLTKRLAGDQVARSRRGAEAAPVRPAQADHPQWLDDHLVCKGGTYPAQLMYQELADMACERITAGVVSNLLGERPIKAVLDPYNPVGSTLHVRSRRRRNPLEDRPQPLSHQLGRVRQQLGGPVLPRGRIASTGARLRQEPQPRVGGAVPLRFPDAPLPPDFVVLVADGRGDDNLLRLVVEGEGLPGRGRQGQEVDDGHLLGAGRQQPRAYGRWAFAELTDLYAMQEDFEDALKASSTPGRPGGATAGGGR